MGEEEEDNCCVLDTLNGRMEKKPNALAIWCCLPACLRLCLSLSHSVDTHNAKMPIRFPLACIDFLMCAFPHQHVSGCILCSIYI